MTRTRVALLLAVVAVAAPVVIGLPAVAAADAPHVLVYSRTAGFRHLSIPDGIATVTELGEEGGYTVEATEDPAIFTDDELVRFDAVVFLNTTGEVMTDEGRAAFERFVRAGGGWVGVHSAADTEYDWDFYGRLLGGAWFLAHPVQQPGVIVNEAADQPSTAHLPERWTIPFEEFYSFRANPRERVRVLLSIDESTYQQDPNTTNLPSEPSIPPTFPEGRSGVMGDHPMSWCVDLGAGRGWYTALGHENYLYRVPEYRQHLLGGILTALQEVDADCRVEAAGSPGGGGPDPAPTPSDAPAAPAPDTAADDGTGAADPLPVTGGAAGVAAGLWVAAAAALVRWRRGGRTG